MKAFFAAFNTSLSPARLAARRRKLRQLLQAEGVELRTLTIGKDCRTAIAHIAAEGRACPVVAIDDRHGLPSKAPWAAELTREVTDLAPDRRPLLVYVTRRASGAGRWQESHHPVVRAWIKRDESAKWVQDAARAVLELAAQIKAREREADVSSLTPVPDVVGSSPCFREALGSLDDIMSSAYGLVTGEPGAGKMFLIGALWRQIGGGARMIVLPCGSFFKDYYVAGSRRRIGGGREAVDQLTPYLVEADQGLLVLHHVEELPLALQEELAVRLPSSADGSGPLARLTGVDHDGLVEYDVKLIATSSFPLTQLEQTGRLIPDLAGRLRKRQVRIPSLARRGREDVEQLCRDIVRRISRRRGLSAAPRIGRDVLGALSRQNWPNNISDLVRVLEHAMRRCRGEALTKQHLAKGMDWSPAAPRLDEIVAQAQRAAIENALEHTGGSVAEAARSLGVTRYRLYRLMPKLGLKTTAKKRRPG